MVRLMKKNSNTFFENNGIIRYVLDKNLSIIQMADTKVGVLLAINAIIISLSGIWDVSPNNSLFKYLIIFAVCLSGTSALLFILVLFPRNYKIPKSRFFFTGGVDISENRYIEELKEFSSEDVKIEMIKCIRALFFVQKEKYFFLTIGLIFLILSFALIVISFIIKTI